MKRFLSAVLSLVMMISMLQTASAAQPEDITLPDVPNPLPLTLQLEVLARESGSGTAYETAPHVAYETGKSANVDYKASLNMQPIRNFLEVLETAFTSGGKYETQKDKFDAATIDTQINVVIKYHPSYVKSGVDLANYGGLVSDNGIFEETGRKVEGDKATITYKNRALTAGELYSNYHSLADPVTSGYLADLAFVLDDALAYTQPGEYVVSVTMSGETVIDFGNNFGARKQIVTYNGEAKNILTIVEQPRADHMLVAVPAKPATCTEDGHTQAVKCQTHDSYDCGAYGVYPPQTIPKLNHMIGDTDLRILIPAIPATCATDGVKEHHTCALCKQDFLNGVPVKHEDLIIPRSTIPHTPVTIPGTAPTCIHAGLTSSTVCGVCGKVLSPAEVILPKGHDVESKPGKAPTCTEDGYTEEQKCKVCNLVIVSSVPQPALGHIFGEWVVVQEPTEQAPGKKERVCPRCGLKEELIIPKLEHVHKVDEKASVITKAPECDEEGKMDTYCACGELIEKNVKIPATGHRTSKISAVPATCTQKGLYEHYLCVNCGETFRDQAATQKFNNPESPKDPHNHNNQEVVIPGRPATCIRKGLTDGLKCGACNKVLVKQTQIPLADHDLQFVREGKPTCTTPGVAAHWHCTVCNGDFDEHGDEWDISFFEVPATGHDYGEAVPKPGFEPTEDIEGIGVRTCKNDHSHIIEVRMGKLSHTHDANSPTHEVITKEPTCTSTGLKSIVYDCCSKIKQENIEVPKRTDTLVFVDGVPSTCFTEGTKSHYTCKNCDKLFSSEDTTEQITKEDLVLTKLEHHFKTILDTPTEHVERCEHCGETIRTVKENVSNNVDISNINTFKNEVDILAEEFEKEENPGVEIAKETIITVEEREDPSPEIHVELPKTIDEEKVVYEITVEKITKHITETASGAKEEKIVQRETISKTDDLITIVVTIPAEMRNKEGYAVYRRHHTEEKGHHIHVMTSTKNDHGEWIEYLDSAGTVTENASIAHKLQLHAMNFSEYVIVSFSSKEDVPTDPTPIDPTAPSGTPGKVNLTNTVKFNANGGTPVDSIKVNKGQTITAPETTREGYTFAGWYSDIELTKPFDFDTPIRNNMTLYAKWRQDGVPVVSVEIGGVSQDITVNTEGGKNTVNVDEIEVPEKDGFAFTGWFTNPQLTNEVSGVIEITSDTKLYPGYICLIAPEVLISEEHIAYIHGYPDGEVKPNGNITREEVVAALHRLFKPEHNEKIATTEHNFPDVNEGRWSEESIATMANGGYIVGDQNGNFNPSKPITRAEFVTIAVKFMNQVEVPKANYFSDIQGHWAEESIKKAAHSFYWILGYEDGTFRPNNFITRAEAITIINKMLVRYGDHTSEHATDWPDVSESDWYYSNIIEATTHAHTYDRHDNGWSEVWTGLAE